MEAFRKEQFESIRGYADAYNVSKTTLSGCINGGSTRAEVDRSKRNLNEEETHTLVEWILSRGHPVRFMADQLLSAHDVVMGQK